MATQIKISNDCKIFTITDGPATAEYQLYYNNFKQASDIYELDDPAVAYDPNTNPYSLVTAPTLDNNGGIELNMNNIGNANEEKMNGVFFMIITDGAGEQTTVGLLSVCDINCCLANQTAELLKCNCTSCEECSSLLDEVSKIYLLIHGAETNTLDCVQTLETYDKAYEKYLKAKEMCGVSNCNCNC